MSLPSMVERSGGRLVVRSLVSGATLMETNEATATAATATATNTTAAEECENAIASPARVDSEFLERQLELLQTQLIPLTIQQLPARESPARESPAEEELPQCKIRRNYSCHACAFFTQNPRIHLSHMRDVHGEKIVINECKLCLYASRHFQKLVRHMKMVHGCTDNDGSGISSRRHCNREARKRRLEESIEPPAGPTLKQLKCELEMQEQQLQHNVDVFNRQQHFQQLQMMANRNGNIFSMAFEYQLAMMPPIVKTVIKEEKKEPIRETATTTTTSTTTIATQIKTEPKNSPKTVEAVDLTASIKPTRFQCDKCPYNTIIRSRYTKHVKYHTMPLIKCHSCDFHSPYKWNLDRHTKNHGANGYFKCNVCDFSTNIKQSLTVHELNHHVVSKAAAEAQQPQDQSAELAEPPEEEEEEEATISPRSSTPEEQPSTISCPSAMELTNHLQQCEAVLRNTNTQSLDLEPGVEEEYRNDLSYCGVETAPGYGEVTDHLSPEDADALKKVFKCPHCTFWAATASRFHVHIVGHLNRKPFECSLCSYRSNWRWDITKHIRLKAMRDKDHNQAEVLMNDETGRRNYAKYTQYLTLMKVNASQAVDGRTIRCGEMLSINHQEEETPEPIESPNELIVDPEPIVDSIAALDLSAASKKDLSVPSKKDLSVPSKKDLSVPSKKDLSVPSKMDLSVPIKKDSSQKPKKSKKHKHHSDEHKSHSKSKKHKKQSSDEVQGNQTPTKK